MDLPRALKKSFFALAAFLISLLLYSGFLPSISKQTLAQGTCSLKITLKNATGSTLTGSWSVSQYVATYNATYVAIGSLPSAGLPNGGSYSTCVALPPCPGSGTYAKVTWSTSAGKFYDTVGPAFSSLTQDCVYDDGSVVTASKSNSCTSNCNPNPNPVPVRPTDVCGNGINEDSGWDSVADEGCYPYGLDTGTQTCASGTTVNVPFSWSSPASENIVKVDGSQVYDGTARSISVVLAHDSTHSWTVTAVWSGGTADVTSGGSFYTIPCYVPSNFNLSFYYYCSSTDKNKAWAHLQWAKAVYADTYWVYRSNSKSGNYTKVGATSDLFFDDSVSSTTNPPQNYFWKVFAINSPRYDFDGQGTWSTGANGYNVGISVPTNTPGPGSGFDLNPTCNAGFDVTATKSKINIESTDDTGSRFLQVTVSGAPAQYQGIVSVNVDENSTPDSNMQICDGKGFNKISGVNSGITIQCANASGGGASPIDPKSSTTINLYVKTNNVPKGDYSVYVLVCDNIDMGGNRKDNPTHYRLKFNNPWDSSITGSTDSANPSPDNCYPAALTISVLTTPWYQVKGGDVGSRGGIDLPLPPSGKFNVIGNDNTYGKVAMYAFQGVKGVSPQTDNDVWRIGSYSPKLQVGPYYSSLSSATGDKKNCVQCGRGGLPTGGTGLYSTGDYTISGDNTPNGQLVIFVGGNLAINGDIKQPSSSDGVIFIVSGDVSIKGSVHTVYATIIADGTVTFNNIGTDKNTLNYYGTVAGSGGVAVDRNLSADADANTPAVAFFYDTRYILNFASLLGTISANWQEVAP